MVNSQSQAYRQKCRNNRYSQQSCSAQYSNPFKTSRQYQPSQSLTGNGGSNIGNTGAGASAGRRNVIFDVTPENENK